MATDYDDTIIDSSKPNAGRIYDYFLGGHNHLPVDRQMAENIKKQAPFIVKLAIMTRWFLRLGIRRGVEQGFLQFLDYASGLPTEDHIHNNTPAGTKVIYSDIDPVTVQIGKKLIGENSLVKYETCDAANPEKLLESHITKSLFGNNHKVVIGYNGIFWFLNNKQINHAMQVLYEWADAGSILYLTDYDSGDITEEGLLMKKLYADMKMTGEDRTKEELIEIVKPWKVQDPGFLPIEEWRGISQAVGKEASENWGGSGPFGGFLIK